MQIICVGPANAAVLINFTYYYACISINFLRYIIMHLNNMVTVLLEYIDLCNLLCWHYICLMLFNYLLCFKIMLA